MTESDAIQCLESLGLQVEALLPSVRPNGYIIIDPIRPDGIYGSDIPCTLMTYFWQEGQEWIWESHLVVPGPGPRHRFQSLAELVGVVIKRYHACRKTNHAET